MNKKPSIFDYLDYRKFLKDYYGYMKSNNNEFSFRYFAKIAKLKSENYLKLVIDGKVHLSSSYRNKFANGCDLSEKEREFFYKLIEFTKAKEIKKKNSCLKKLSQFSKENLQQEISIDQYKVLSKWYYMVIRSLVTLDDFSPDPHYMAKKLKGFVSPKEAKEALDVLLEIGLVKCVNKRFSLVDKHITTKDEVQITAARNFHAQMIPVGVSALTKDELDEREIRAVTLGVTKAKAQEAKQRIKNFYKELVQFLNSTSGDKIPEEIWQLNVQFFKFTD